MVVIIPIVIMPIMVAMAFTIRATVLDPVLVEPAAVMARITLIDSVFPVPVLTYVRPGMTAEQGWEVSSLVKGPRAVIVR
jgi:hypothetical protein